MTAPQCSLMKSRYRRGLHSTTSTKMRHAARHDGRRTDASASHGGPLLGNLSARKYARNSTMRFQSLYSGWKPPREDGDERTIHGILSTDCGLGPWDAQALPGAPHVDVTCGSWVYLPYPGLWTISFVPHFLSLLGRWGSTLILPSRSRKNYPMANPLGGSPILG
jgi:hypothetical protein